MFRFPPLRSCTSATGRRMYASQPPPSWASWRVSPPYANEDSSIPLPTYARQQSLPRLPVPPLPQTLDGLIHSASHLANDTTERDMFLRRVEDFAKSPLTKQLQSRLQERAADPSIPGWLAEWWDTAAYMSYRDSVVINVSYYYGFDLPDLGDSKQTRNVAAFAHACLVFRSKLIRGEIPVEFIGKNPICMQQYKWLFNACRIPAPGKDYAVKIPEDSHEGQHIVVIRQNRFYEVPILDSRGNIISEGSLKSALDHIKKASVSNDATVPPVGVLTAVNRDLWTENYQYLLQTSHNALKSIQKSAFVICLDKNTSGEDLLSFSRNAWHGDGRNRWFDKPLQIIAGEDGRVSITGEHSCMDGTPTAKLCDVATKEIWNRNNNIHVESSPPTVPTIKELTFKIDDKILLAIEKASKEFDDHISQTELHVGDYTRYGSTIIKSLGFSPDSWTQMLMQLAYRLTYGYNVATYEAAQTRKFLFGRTEAVRVCTPESTTWAASMLDSSINKDERKRLLQAAVKRHRKDLLAATDGAGIDRHLFGLKMCLQNGEKAPELFQDPVYQRSSTWNLSTSQVFMDKAPAYGWGNVTPEGFGVPYLIRADRLQFVVANTKGTKGEEYFENLSVAGDMLLELVAEEDQVRSML